MADTIVNEIIIAVKNILWHIHFKEVNHAKSIKDKRC